MNPKDQLAEIEKEIKKNDLKFGNAQMYADMDEEDFWRTSTISQLEAQKKANKLCDVLNLSIAKKQGFLLGIISQLKTCKNSIDYDYKIKIQKLTEDLKFYEDKFKELKE